MFANLFCHKVCKFSGVKPVVVRASYSQSVGLCLIPLLSRTKDIKNGIHSHPARRSAQKE